MQNRSELKERAEKALGKKAAIGPDIDLGTFETEGATHKYLSDEDMLNLPEQDKQRLVLSGVDVAEKERGGTFFQKDTTVVHCKTKQDGIQVIPMRKAL